MICYHVNRLSYTLGINTWVYYTHTGMVSSRVGSDIRSLYAICAIDDYELLKKEIGENNILLCSMETLLKERMKQFRHATPSQVSFSFMWRNIFRIKYKYHSSI